MQAGGRRKLRTQILQVPRILTDGKAVPKTHRSLLLPGERSNQVLNGLQAKHRASSQPAYLGYSRVESNSLKAAGGNGGH